MLSELLIILALVLLNGVFSGAEIAILSLRKTRLVELVEAGSGSARAIAALREHPEGFLATVQIGITVIGASAAAFGGASVAGELAPLFARVPFLAPFAENLAIGLVVAGVSFLSLVLGELVPKSLALRAGESYALLVAPPLRALAWVGHPVVRVLTGASNLVLRLFGDRTTFTEARLSREEIQQIVEEAATAGSVDASAGEIASRALDFGGLDAYTVMVPRRKMVTMSVDVEAAEIAHLARRSGHGRVPVYEGAEDNFIGFVNLAEVLAAAMLDPEFSLRALLHPLPAVPDTLPATTVLRKLQQERSTLALVSDEQGMVVGLVTVDDLVEEIIGEMLSENDRPNTDIVRQPDGSWLVDGSVPIHELNRKLNMELPEGDYSTLAGLCLELAASIPPVGWAQVAHGVGIEVVEATARRVRRLRLRHTPGAGA